MGKRFSMPLDLLWQRLAYPGGVPLSNSSPAERSDEVQVLADAASVIENAAWDKICAAAAAGEMSVFAFENNRSGEKPLSWYSTTLSKIRKRIDSENFLMPLVFSPGSPTTIRYGDDLGRGNIFDAPWFDPMAIIEESFKIAPDRNALFYTGAAGRPSASHLAAFEFEQLLEAGEIDPSNKTAASKLLSEHVGLKYPDAPPLTPKTIQNNIGAWHAEIRRKQQARSESRN